MSTAITSAPKGRIDYVGQSTRVWVLTMLKQLTIKDLEAFANGAEKTAHEKSREYTCRIKGDADALTNHANCMRATSAKIVLLRGGLVPALKIEPGNPIMWRDAVSAMGWIRADFEAMDCDLR